METVIKRDLLIITLLLLLIFGCTKATVEYFKDENGIMYVEYNGNPNTQSPFTGEIRHTATAYLTFVAIDKNNKPSLIPKIKPESGDETRRYNRAKARHLKRRKKRLK